MPPLRGETRGFGLGRGGWELEVAKRKLGLKSSDVHGSGTTTLITKVRVELFPRVSVAEQLTVVAPIGNIEPDVEEHATGRTPSTSSNALAVNVATAPAGFVAVSR